MGGWLIKFNDVWLEEIEEQNGKERTLYHWTAIRNDAMVLGKERAEELIRNPLTYAVMEGA